MIQYQRFQLDNGLRVLLHQDRSTPLVAVYLSYFVGTRDEEPGRTGFAHLFEHLMFGGTPKVPNYDDPLQEAGAENNAYTNHDSTNFYTLIPKDNLEIAIALEADRMQHLRITPKALAVQQKVVVEEFKETCLEEPFGDLWHHLGPLVYPKHPYQIPVIGERFEDIEEATLEDVRVFRQRYYQPANAVLSISGNIEATECLELVKRWFGPIEGRKVDKKALPLNEKPQGPIYKTVEVDVPFDAIFISFPMADRLDINYYVDDLLSDILGTGESARLPSQLRKKEHLFSEVDAYITGSMGEGLLIIQGNLAEGISFEQAEEGIWRVLEELREKGLPPRELQKLKNNVESDLEQSEMSVLNKASSLAFFEMQQRVEEIQLEGQRYQSVRPEQLQQRANEILRPENAVILRYQSTM